MSNHSSITKMRKQLTKNQVITPAGDMIFHPSPEAKALRSKPPAGFGFKLDLNKVNSPEKTPEGSGFKLDLNKINSPEKAPDDDFYEDKSECVQSTA